MFDNDYYYTYKYIIKPEYYDMIYNNFVIINFKDNPQIPQDSSIVLYPNNDDSYHIYSIGHSNGYTINNLKLNCGVNITKNDLQTTILPNIEKMLLYYQNTEDNIDNRFIKEKDGLSYSKIISVLNENGLVKVRDTDHEYRKDSRNITWIKDYNIDYEISVDSLEFNQDKDEQLINHFNFLEKSYVKKDWD